MAGISLTIVLASIIYPLSSEYKAYFFPGFVENLIKNHQGSLEICVLTLRKHKKIWLEPSSKMLIGSFVHGDIKCRAVCVTNLTRH